MPGRLPGGPFRPGNLAESLGVLLLRGVAAVAEVSRPDDVGVDAFATLLRGGEDGHYYAEDGFVVQLKSETDRPLKYAGHELTWLVNQAQPMFIGLVSLKEATIALHPTFPINLAVLALHAEEAAVQFTDPPFDLSFFANAPGRWVGVSGTRTVRVFIPEPLLKWSLADLTNPAWRSNAYATLKCYIAAANRETQLLKIGRASDIDWKRNDPDSIRTAFIMAKGGAGDLSTVAEHLKPVLETLFLHSFTLPEAARNAILLPILGLAAGLRDIGVEIDPEDQFTKFCASLCTRSATGAHVAKPFVEYTLRIGDPDEGAGDDRQAITEPGQTDV